MKKFFGILLVLIWALGVIITNAEEIESVIDIPVSRSTLQTEQSTESEMIESVFDEVLF